MRESTVFSVNKLKIQNVRTASRSVFKVFKGDVKDPPVFDGRMEMDTHADTFVAGRNCILMKFTERVCDVMPYDESYEAKKNVPISQVATGYTTSNGDRFILVINEAILMPELPHSLANPNQFRDYGVTVQDNPYSEEPMVIEVDDDDHPFVAVMKSEGTNIY